MQNATTNGIAADFPITDHTYADKGDDPQLNLSTLLDNLRSAVPPKQEICLTGDDSSSTFAIDSREVDIVTSAASGQAYPASASNKVKATPMVKYDWENRYYYGNLVAVHRNGVFMAYVIYKGKYTGVVRLINRVTAERELLKEFNGRISDLAFAIADEVMLAVIDESGLTYIYRVDMDRPQLVTYLALRIRPPITDEPSEYNRLIWCPYIPEDTDTEYDTDEALSRVLLVTRGEKAEIWYIDALLASDRSTVNVSSANDEGAVITIDSHDQPIADAAFAPDASAIATAGLDGDVKFFQADIVVPNNPRCLHQWQPHGGRPLSSLCFLDDHKSPQKCLQFWKYCVTGAEHNTELKVWTCQTWTCLQIIRFLPGPSSDPWSDMPCIRAVLDPSATYLILSDIKRQVLYVLELLQDNATESSESSKPALALFTSISEFVLAQPCLSFVITDAKTKRFKRSLNDSHLDEITTGELDNGEGDADRGDDETTSPGVHIKMFSVHPKMLQELQLMYKKETGVVNDSTGTDVGSMGDAIRDGLSDLSMDAISSDMSHDQPILLTPNAFTTSLSRDLQGLDGHLNSISSSSSLTHVTPMQDELLSPHALSASNIPASTTPATVTPSSSKGYSPLPDLHPVPGLQLGDLSPQTSEGEGTPRDTAPLPQMPVSLDGLNDAVSTVHGSMDSSPRTSLVTSSVSTDVGQFNIDLMHQPAVAVASPCGAPTGVVSPFNTAPDYDEMDVEVAETMGEDCVEISTVTEEVDDGSPDYETDPEQTMIEISTDRPPWPKPPDMTPGEPRARTDDVDVEAQRLAELAIDSACRVDQSDSGLAVADDAICKQPVGEIKWDSSSTHDVSKDSRTDDDDDQTSLDRSRGQTLTNTIAMDQVQSTLTQILATVQQQQRDINLLRTTVLAQQEQQLLFQQQLQEGTALREAVGVENPPNADAANFVQLEELITARVERILSQQAQRNKLQLENIVSTNEAQMEKHHTQLVAMVTQSLNNTIPHRMERTIKQEVKNTIHPSVTKVLEDIKFEVHSELMKKLTATDSVIKDGIGKLIKSKQVVDSIGHAAGNVIKAPIQASYKEAFQKTVVPSFEASCKAMYSQLNDTFQKGTTDYCVQLQSHIAKTGQKLKEARDPLIQQLRSFAASFNTEATELKQSIATDLRTGVDELGARLEAVSTSVVDEVVQKRVDAEFQSLRESLITEIREAVRAEVSQILSQHTNDISETVAHAVRSSAATPVPTTPSSMSRMAHITQLAKQGDMNAAFEEALSASNIDLVIGLCKQVDTVDVFDPHSTCPLQQPILLSLIQQLSADLPRETELKHRFLREAIMTLDPSHPVTREHMRAILVPLCLKLKQFTQSCSQHPMAKSLRILLMAAQSLVSP